MPQLIALALVGTAVYVGYKWFSKRQKLKERGSAAPHRSAAESQDLGELRWDEVEGVYRPRRKD